MESSFSTVTTAGAGVADTTTVSVSGAGDAFTSTSQPA